MEAGLQEGACRKPEVRAHARARRPVEEWETWPFDGALAPRALAPRRRTPRHGAGVGCRAARATRGALADDTGSSAARRPTGCRRRDPRDSTSTSSTSRRAQAELGPLLIRVQRAVRAIERRRQRARLPLGRRQRALPRLVHGAPRAHPAADRLVRGDLGRRPARRCRRTSWRENLAIVARRAQRGSGRSTFQCRATVATSRRRRAAIEKRVIERWPSSWSP